MTATEVWIRSRALAGAKVAAILGAIVGATLGVLLGVLLWWLWLY